LGIRLPPTFVGMDIFGDMADDPDRSGIVLHRLFPV